MGIKEFGRFISELSADFTLNLLGRLNPRLIFRVDPLFIDGLGLGCYLCS